MFLDKDYNSSFLEVSVWTLEATIDPPLLKKYSLFNIIITKGNMVMIVVMCTSMTQRICNSVHNTIVNIA